MFAKHRQTQLDQFFSVKCGKATEPGSKIGNRNSREKQPKAADERLPSLGGNINNEDARKRSSATEAEKPSKRSKHDVEFRKNDDVDDRTALENVLTDTESSAKECNFKESLGEGNSISASASKRSSILDTIGEEIDAAIDNLNHVRQDGISRNEFNLQEIYENKRFNVTYKTRNSNLEVFQLKQIVFPRDYYADQLLMIVMSTFKNPINCVYFEKAEINFVFSLFTLCAQSQMLFVRLFKRKRSWHRTDMIKYPEIAKKLDPFCLNLVQNGFFTSDLKSIDVSILLNMLQLKELQCICKSLKLNHRNNKTVLMNTLIEYGNSSKSFYAGSKSPESVLRSTVLSILKNCVRLSDRIMNLLDRVLTLFHPLQSASEDIPDLFLMLMNVQSGELLYPPTQKTEDFPIFQSKSHLIKFIESKTAFKDIILYTESKDWNGVRNLGRLAFSHLSKVKTMENTLPLHIKKFMPEYLWEKVLSKSIVAFKKAPETIIEIKNVLKTLINLKHCSKSSLGKWYTELALIEMHYQKDLEGTAALILEALNQDTLSEVDASILVKRMNKLMKRKTGISDETRALVTKAQENMKSESLDLKLIPVKTINASTANRIRHTGKTTWCLSVNSNEKYYGSVEMLAVQYYISQEGFHNGLHCEGSLSVTLFAVYFWDELYNIFVPGSFISPFQDAPLDLFTNEFSSNREQSVEEKINFILNLDVDTFADWMHERYCDYIKYKSLMCNTLFQSDQHFKEIVTCLGVHGVTGICKKVISNFKLWRSGFPDLILWNAQTSKCKIVEVKGPSDTLSDKQKLWLEYLNEIGIEVEVCHVEATRNRSK